MEREIKADQVVWILRFRRASDDLKDAYTKISADRDTTIDFLRKQGFKDKEITRQPTRTIDKLAREFGQSQGAERFRYVVTSALEVTTANVDQVTTSLGATEELLKSGVVLDGEQEGGKANPRYIISTFNALRPQLLAEATKNARATAQQFASDSGTKVERIRSANQGTIQIFGTDGNDESAPYSQTSTPAKKIRVVSTFEFELK
ncbi:MAG: SIMPL domain-containing protein [Thermodesulfobacteriota bacterium]